MSDGPTSMLDTIELVGFDDDKTRRNESPRQPAKETKTVKEGAVRRSPIGAAQGGNE